MKDKNFGRIPQGKGVVCFDIGVGANCIYPILGISEYGWSFVGSDISQEAIHSAEQIVSNNEILKGAVHLRLQENSKDYFYGNPSWRTKRSK